MMYRAMIGLVLVATALPAVAADPVSFRRDVAPLLLDNCLACHGPKKAEGGYRVDSYERSIAEGDSATPGFAADDTEGSEAFRRIVSDDPDERMPLDSEPLSAEQVDVLRRWIAEGIGFDGPDPKAELASIIPPPVYPDPPAAYGHPLPITALAFSPDGTRLYASGYHEITAWNPSSGELLERIKNVGQRTLSLEVSPDGLLLAAGGGAPGKLGEARLYDRSTGQLKQVLGSTSDVVLDVAFDPAGKRLATAAADGIVRIFDLASGELVLSITSHSDWVHAVVWNQDGTRLATASRDKTAKVFDAQTGDLLVTYSGHGQPVNGVAFHPDGAEVCSSGADNKLHWWKIDDGKKSGEAAFGGEVNKVHASGELLIAASADKSVRQFEAKTHKQTRSYAGLSDWALSCAIHTQGKLLAGGAFDGKVIVWNLDSGEPVAQFLATPGYPPEESKPSGE